MRQVLQTPNLARPTSLLTLAGVVTHLGAMAKSLVDVIGDHAWRLNRVLPKDGTEAMTGPLVLKTYTTATRPTASSWTGGIIYVSDGGGGAVFQGSDGTDWVNLG